MTNLQAALGVAQMEELQQFIETKHRNYILYKERFREVSFGTLLPFREEHVPTSGFIHFNYGKTGCRERTCAI